MNVINNPNNFQVNVSYTANAVLVTVGAAATHFSVSAPSSATAGAAFSVTVTALDQFNHVASGYTGTVQFTTSDSGTGSAVPANYTFTGGDNGVHTFTNGVTFVTAGSQTLTVTDTTTSSITGTATVTVNAAAATHFGVSAPSSTTAGAAFSITVTALDAYGNTATSYAGTVHFTKSDSGSGSAVPVDYTFTTGTGNDNGVHTFTNGVTFVTAGSQTVTATDTATSSITGTAAVTVTAATATHLSVSAPSSTTAGAAFSITVTALDQFGNTATNYAGTVHFTTSDSGSGAAVPANYTFTTGTGNDNGVHTFTNGVTFVTAGSQTVTATDTTTSSITGTATVTVSAATATHLSVAAPSSATAGAAFSITVTALDAFGNTATGYTGTVHFTKSDSGSGSTVPANYTFTTGSGSDNGVHTFTNAVTFVTAGSQSLTATDTTTGSINGTATVSVTPSTATHFTLAAPSSATAGTAFNYTVDALDAFNNVATGYSGTIHFTSSDASATLPANGTLSNGVATFSATLRTAGAQTVTATDTVTASITGTTSLTITAANATHFSVSAPASATAGNSFSITVTALDAFGNTATNYTGTVHFTTSDSGSGAAVPANYTFTTGSGNDNGVHTFTNGVTFVTVGSQTLTATDTTTSSLTGSASVTVSAANASHFSLSAPSSATAGNSFIFTVTALDPFNNTAGGYTGTVHFTSSDSQASLPDNSTLTNGVGNFIATLNTVGSQTLTATDTTNSGISGTSNSITVTHSTAPATHFSITASPSATAGSAFSVTVTALDSFGNTVTDYAGTVHFASTDSGSGAVVPMDYTFTTGTGGDNGVHTFPNGVTFVTAGSQTVTATDTTTSSITGSASVTVSAATASHFSLSAPSSASAGTAFILTVTALDPFNNTANGYTGTVHFASSDSQASLPANSTLTNGVGNFIAILKTAGNQTLTATDTVTNTITGTSNAIAVSAAAATHFLVSAPSSATAGSSFSFTVTAEDQFDNTATAYAGTVHFTSSDGAATLPTNSTLTNGVGTFSATLKTAGNQTITATDTVTSSITGTSNAIAVSAAAATHFVVSAPSSATAGSSFSFTVTAEDQFDNTATSYAGTVHFTSSAGQATLPTNSTLTNGTGTFSATLDTAGNQTLTATDTTTSAITGTSNAIAVSAANATHYTVTTSTGSVTAGTALNVTVTALDAFGNTASGYTGTVHFTSSDTQASLPSNSTLTNGAGSFSATLKTAGNQTITATDTATSSLTATSTAVNVTAAALNHLLVSAPTGTVITGTAFNFTVTAVDTFNNAVSGYSGTVHFTSSDSAASLPANSTLTNGTGAFSATLNTSGSQTLTATDTVTNSLTGTSNAIAVRGLIVTSFTQTPTGFTATFSKPFVNSSSEPIHLYNAASAALGAADVTLVGASTGVVHGSLLVNATNTGFTFLKTDVSTTGGTTGLLAADTYTVTFVSGSTAFKDLTGALLDGNADGVNGDNYTTTFTVAAPSGVVVSIPDFARGPDATDVINVTNTTSNGIPLTLSNGNGVTDATFVLQYNANLLTITGGTVNPALTGASFTVTTSGSGSSAVATIVFHSATALAAGAVRLGGLTATVPNNAPYKSKELLHFSSVSLNGGAITAIADDGVHVVAYLGDVSGDGTYTSADSVLISRVASSADSGFAAFPVLDPVIVGDLSGSVKITSTDVTLMNKYLSGSPTPQVPNYPGAPSNNPAGPDPALSLPATIQVSSDGTIRVPVNIDDPHPQGSTGLTQALLALTYDPNVLSVSAADISLGTVPAAGTGWTLQATVDARSGQIAIILFSATPLSTDEAGSLVTIDFHVQPGVTTVTTPVELVAAVDPNGKGVMQTALADDQGLLTLDPGSVSSNGATAEGVVDLTTADATELVSQSQPAVPQTSIPSALVDLAPASEQLPVAATAAVPAADTNAVADAVDGVTLTEPALVSSDDNAKAGNETAPSYVFVGHTDLAAPSAAGHFLFVAQAAARGDSAALNASLGSGSTGTPQLLDQLFQALGARKPLAIRPVNCCRAAGCLIAWTKCCPAMAGHSADGSGTS